MPKHSLRQIATQPDPYAPFRISQAIEAGGFVFVSGQAALDLQGNLVGGDDFEAQAEQAFTMLATVLQTAGSSMARVVKVTIYLTDMAHFPSIVRLREKHFTRPYPADTIVQVGQLALPDLQIEIDAVALAG
ncbi:MAG: RidA family protein [Proteobacteria bacterium]|nr:MAG: RidA family protein [Pseudomonadota bacterium]MBC6945177.1 RidA family protein [Gammaproteobacteria bacterium]MCE7896282.1 RidA family protein [Gammaproteobacteria bacterium PRO8]MDL1880787.1 RidA family protein [Gammaproteobacteria bacterium PRO2]MCL4778446.1 RidA family protein [Gammaproteobacteria bacterium]